MRAITQAQSHHRRRSTRPHSRVLFSFPQLTTAIPSGAGGASLRIEAASFEVEHLRLIGSIHGVVPLFVAGRNGPGMGRLASKGDGTRLQWQAPGGSRFGPAVLCDVDGIYLLRDADDPDKYIRIQVLATSLLAGVHEARVILDEVYNNAVASDDVTAAEASAGSVESWALTLRNVSNSILSQLRAWIDRNTVNMEISDDGAAWVSPTDEGAALDFGDLGLGVTMTLYVRRTVAAGAASHGGLLNLLHFSFRG
ncbi:hypothetical protein LCGC14_0605890 [marine sediment metagenome]|uniref:Uncharacterized protein n=1 Tax=marine sediment metagenome TaxID=412755 RepID=A0A0F9RT77_9ZZZZ